MAVSEESRHRLHGRLEEILGREEAAALMEYLPPVGWADVATKRDLDHMSAVLRGELAVMESKLEARFETGLASLETRVEAGLARVALDARSGLRTLFVGLAGLQMSGAALALAVARAA